MKEAGFYVPDFFDKLPGTINQVYTKLVMEGEIVEDELYDQYECYYSYEEDAEEEAREEDPEVEEDPKADEAAQEAPQEAPQDLSLEVWLLLNRRMESLPPRS